MIAGYTISALAGLIVATRLSPRAGDETIATVPAESEAALRTVALRVLGDAGHTATLAQAEAFAQGFLAELATVRYGVRTLRASVVQDWIAAQLRAVA